MAVFTGGVTTGDLGLDGGAAGVDATFGGFDFSAPIVGVGATVGPDFAGGTAPGGSMSSKSSAAGLTGGVDAFAGGLAPPGAAGPEALGKGAAFLGGGTALGDTDAACSRAGAGDEAPGGRKSSTGSAGSGRCGEGAGFRGGTDFAGGIFFRGGMADPCVDAGSASAGFTIGREGALNAGAAADFAGGFDPGTRTGLPHFGHVTAPASFGFAANVALQWGHATEAVMRRRSRRGERRSVEESQAECGGECRSGTSSPGNDYGNKNHCVRRRAGCFGAAPSARFRPVLPPMTIDPGLPPRQRPAAPGKWPVVGERNPAPWHEPWRLTVAGDGVKPVSWTLDELRAMGGQTEIVEFHCVTRWSRRDVAVTGISVESLLKTMSVEIPESVEFISWVARSERAHSSSLPLREALSQRAMLVWEVDGKPLPPEHGGPLRGVVPGKYFYKSVKWVERIDLLVRDRLGYWEANAGYHNGADPWLEERYVAGGLSREELRGLLATLDWSGREVLGLIAEGRDLANLVAKGSLLRNANFRGANLTGADFSGANLSNASFASASLKGATLEAADVEGAEFDGADLSDADFRGASLFGATFVGATVNRRTRFEQVQLEALADSERAFLSDALKASGVADDESNEDRFSV